LPLSTNARLLVSGSTVGEKEAFSVKMLKMDWSTTKTSTFRFAELPCESVIVTAIVSTRGEAAVASTVNKPLEMVKLTAPLTECPLSGEKVYGGDPPTPTSCTVVWFGIALSTIHP
jgi:hypothetical protein